MAESVFNFVRGKMGFMEKVGGVMTEEAIREQISWIRQDIQQINNTMRELADAVQRIAVVEERQAFVSSAIDRLSSRMDKIEDRLKNLEEVLPVTNKMGNVVSTAVFTAIAAIVGAAAMFVAKKTGLLG